MDLRSSALHTGSFRRESLVLSKSFKITTEDYQRLPEPHTQYLSLWHFHPSSEPSWPVCAENDIAIVLVNDFKIFQVRLQLAKYSGRNEPLSLCSCGYQAFVKSNITLNSPRQFLKDLLLYPKSNFTSRS